MIKRASRFLLHAPALMLAFVAVLGAEEPDFRFVIISDTQPKLESQWGQMETAIAQANEMVPDAAFFIIPGDLIHGEDRNDNPDTPEIESPNSVEDLERWKEIATRMIKVPWYATPGNHEYSTELGPCHYHPAGGKWNRAPRPDDSPEELKRFEAIIGPAQWSFEHKGVRFVGMNTWENDAWPRLEPNQVEWLRKELSGPERMKLVFGHHQLMLYRFGRTNVKSVTEILAILDETKTTAYIHGHLHEMERIQEETGLWHLSLPGIAWDGRVKTKKGWMWFEVFKDRIDGYYKPLNVDAATDPYVTITSQTPEN